MASMSTGIYGPAAGDAEVSFRSLKCMYTYASVLSAFPSAAGASDGKLIVAGGATLSSAEQYDPSTGQWTALADMSTTRYGPAAGEMTTHESGGSDCNIWERN
jgi:hypothetical protein